MTAKIWNIRRDVRHGDITIIDDIPYDIRSPVYSFVCSGGWNFGWKSKPATDQYGFFHKQFAGHTKPDHEGGQSYDCEEAIHKYAPLEVLWKYIRILQCVPDSHSLVRCYANGYPYGSEGTLHTDSVKTNSMTIIYFPHDKWLPDWGGDTLFFTPDAPLEKMEIIAGVYPRPSRAIIFPGTIPHVARAVTRSCPVMRISLMFKTEAL